MFSHLQRNNLRPPEDENYRIWGVEDTQHKQMNGMWVFLDLYFITILFGISSIIIGIILCTLNYQSPDKKYRQTAQFIINSIWATGLLSFILW